MAGDVLGVFPASEIWGLNRKRPCTLLLRPPKLLVLDRAARGSRRRPERRDPAALEAEAAYVLSLEDIRWVQLTPSLGGTQVKVQTGGGSYRYRLRWGPARRLERCLREVLGARVRRAGTDDAG